MYGGTKTEMERLIADANKVKEANGEMADLSIESFADVVEAIHIMQEEMNISGTTAKEASVTIQGSVNSMKAAWKNLLVGLADDSQDFQGLVNNLVETIVGVEDSEGTRIGGVINNIMPRVSQALEGIGTLFKTMIPELVGYIPELLETVLPGLLEGATALVSSFAEALPGIMDIVVDTIPTLVTSLGDAFVEALGNLTDYLPDLADSVSGVISSLLTYITENADSIISSIADFLSTAITEGIGVLSENSAQLAEALLAVLKAVITAAIEHPDLVAAIAGAQALKSIGGSIITGISGGITSGKSVLGQAIKGLFTGSADSYTSAGTTIGTQMAKATGSSFASGLSTVLGAIAQSGIIVAGATAIWSAYKGYTDYLITSDPGWQAEKQRVEDLMESNGSLADQYDYLVEKVGGAKSAYYALTGEMSEVDGKNRETFAYLEEHNGNWLDLAHYLGYAGDEAEGWAYNMEKMYGELYNTYEAEKAAAEETNYLGEVMGDTAEVIMSSVNPMAEHWTEVFGTEMPGVLKTLISESAQAGISIPQGLVDGLASGEINAQNAMHRITALITFDEAVENANIGGLQVSQSFIDSWLSGEYSLQEANDYLNRLIDFTEAIEDASSSGEEVTAEFVNGMLERYGLEGVISAAEEIGENATPTIELNEIQTVGASVPEVMSDSMDESAHLVTDTAGQIAADIVDEFSGLPGDMEDTGDSAGSNLDSGFGSWKGTVSGTVDEMYNFFYSSLGTILPPIMSTWGSNSGQKFNTGLNLWAGDIRATAVNMASSVNSALSRLPSMMSNIGNQAGSGLYNGLSSWAGALSSLAWSIAANINAAARAALQIRSPSRVMAEVGQYTAEGFAAGIQDGTQDVMDSALDMATSAVASANDVLEDLNHMAATAAVSGVAGDLDIAQAIKTAGDNYQSMAAELEGREQTVTSAYLQQIMTLLQKLSEMQMVTDTGELVGALASKMDYAFEAIQLKESRG